MSAKPGLSLCVLRALAVISLYFLSLKIFTPLNIHIQPGRAVGNHVVFGEDDTLLKKFQTFIMKKITNLDYPSTLDVKT
jgi:hypothetical protein